jgi:hypothetical protein
VGADDAERPVLNGYNAERGAVGILVAGCLVMLLGVAAVAIDLGAVYIEDRQDQTAADLAAIAGVLEYAGPATPGGTRDQVLSFVEQNLTATFGAAEWQAIWTACTDVDRPASFAPMPVPAGWPGGSLECISGSADEVRVRIPDQLVESFFGRVIGIDEIATTAVAQARTQFRSAGGVRPFGILNGLAVGQICLTTSPSGQAQPPCDGPDSGNFGTLNSQTWGSPYSTNTVTDCGTPGNDELMTNIALGVDHLIGLAPTFPGSGGAYASYPAASTRLDDCTISGGQAVPSDSSPSSGPVNTMRADTGFSQFNATQSALVTGQDGFPNATGGATPLLQQGPTPSRVDVVERIGGTVHTYDVDNTPLWWYLPTTLPAGIPLTCNRGTVSGAPDQSAAMASCLADYEASGASTPLFSASLGANPRFAWVPQFHFTTWGSGSHWQPIREYRMIYIDTIWFNCNGKYDPNKNDEACGQSGKGMVYDPNGEPSRAELKVGNGNNMKQLRLDQISAFLLPNGAVPEEIAANFPGNRRGPFEVVLTR